VITHFQGLTSSDRVNVLILDDSVISKARAKKVELLSRIFDHSTMNFTKGYEMLTIGWSDGFSFVPVNFAMMCSSKSKNRFNDIDEKIDKRTCGYKRRLEALEQKPTASLNLIKGALNAGIEASYVLMDTWFTH